MVVVVELVRDSSGSPAHGCEADQTATLPPLDRARAGASLVLFRGHCGRAGGLSTVKSQGCPLPAHRLVGARCGVPGHVTAPGLPTRPTRDLGAVTRPQYGRWVVGRRVSVWGLAWYAASETSLTVGAQHLGWPGLGRFLTSTAGLRCGPLGRVTYVRRRLRFWCGALACAVVELAADMHEAGLAAPRE